MIKPFRFIYKYMGWFLLASLILDWVSAFFSPKEIIGQNNLVKLYYFLITKLILSTVLFIFMLLFGSKISKKYFSEKGYGLGHIIAGVLLSLFISIFWFNFISLQSAYSTYGISNIVYELRTLYDIKENLCEFRSVELNKFNDEISTWYSKVDESRFPSRFQGVKAAQLHTFYGLSIDSDKVNIFKKASEGQLILSFSKGEYDIYNKLVDNAKNNDIFYIEFYVDVDGINTGYIKTVQYSEEEYDSSYSIKISMDNSNSYITYEPNEVALDEMSWLIIKDDRIIRVVDANKISKLPINEDVLSDGEYSILLCVDLNLDIGKYTPVSNTIIFSQ